MEGRVLSASELTEVQKSIMRKEISSAEILMEIYDHYISHLQEFSEEQFSKELFELDQKFSYGYCHAIQSKFNKEAKADIAKTQWIVIQKYFCGSRWLFLAGILALVFYVSSQTRSEQELGILLLSPLILLVVVSIAFDYQNFKKLRPIKKTFKGIGIPIYSALARPISDRIYLPVLLAQVLVYLPKIVFPNLEFVKFSPAIAGMITVLLILYTLSLLEVWKIKSKTALI
jgi:hypothetical protein